MVILHIISCPLTNPYCYCLWEREIICRTSKMWKWVNVNFVCLSAYLASFPDVILNTWVCQIKNAQMDEVLLKYSASVGAIVTGDPGVWSEGRSDTVLCTWQWEPLFPWCSGAVASGLGSCFPGPRLCRHLTGSLWGQQAFLWKNPEVGIRWPWFLL